MAPKVLGRVRIILRLATVIVERFYPTVRPISDPGAETVLTLESVARTRSLTSPLGLPLLPLRPRIAVTSCGWSIQLPEHRLNRQVLPTTIAFLDETPVITGLTILPVLNTPIAMDEAQLATLKEKTPPLLCPALCLLRPSILF